MNLFNSYLKKTPNTEIAKHLFIVLLVFSAIHIIFQNIISPLLGNQSDITEDFIDAPFDTFNNEQNTNQESITLVETSQMFWNENLKRDPFFLHILKDTSPVIKLEISKTSNKQYKRSKHNIIEEKPKLTGIIKGADSNFAIIDGKIMKVGDSVRGFYLQSILSRSAKLKKHTKTITIKISDGEDNA